MVQVQNGKATGTLAEILGYAFAASLAGMTADPSDVLGVALTWSGTAWSGKGGRFQKLSQVQALPTARLAAGVVFDVSLGKYQWSGSAFVAVAEPAGEYEPGVVVGLPGSPSSPFATVEALNAAYPSPAPGDVVWMQIGGRPAYALQWHRGGAFKPVPSNSRKKFAGFGASNINNDVTFWVPAVCAAGFECLGRYGEGGKTTGELLAAGYMTQLVSSGATDVIVGPGFNDMAGVIDPSVFQANYNTLIKTIMANGMTPHLVSIQDDYNNGFPGRAIEYNMAIYLLARKYDLQYNDIFIGLQNPDGSFKTGMSVGDNVHMSAAAAAISAARYAARLLDGASDVPLARCKGNTSGAAQKIGLIANQIMEDSNANGEADGWVYGATSTSKSIVATTDGYKSVFTVTATSTAGVAVLLYRNSSLNAAKAYKIALTLRIKIGEMVGANSGQYLATSFQIMSNASGTITGKAQLLSAPGTFDIFCEMDVPAGSTRHDYSILMRGNAAAVNVASVIEVSNMDAIDITDLIY